MTAASLGPIVLVAFLYGAAAMAHGAYLYAEEWNRPSTILLRLAVIVHTAVLGLAVWQSPSHVPFLRLADAALFFTWVVALNYVLFDLLYPVKIAGAFVLPLVSVFLLGTLGAPGTAAAATVPALSGPRLVFHILFAYLSYVLFALSFFSALIYLLQERQLRRKAFFIFFYRLPPLDVLDRFSERFIEVGFPLLTIGLIAGALWAQTAWHAWFSEWKVIWSVITWFIYGVYLALRLVLGWRGRRAAYVSLAGFAAVLANLYVINAFASKLHGF